jgi:hypothetical protein
MEIRELEEEIIEIEKVKDRCRPGSMEWNNIEAIINDKKRKLTKLKTQEDDEEDELPGGCGGYCDSCGGGR